MKLVLFKATILCMALGACDSAIQTTSGADYNTSVPRSEKAIRDAADVEPLLKFPANFCIARTEQAVMVYPEALETKSWLQLAARHADWGTFREVNPAVVNLVQSETKRGYRYEGKADADAVRLAAARQHCDAVLTYEVRGQSGAYAATALLYDVRNGYTYLTASQVGSSKSQAVADLANAVEASMGQLVLALK